MAASRGVRCRAHAAATECQRKQSRRTVALGRDVDLGDLQSARGRAKAWSSPFATTTAFAFIRVNSEVYASLERDGSNGASVHDAGSVAITVASSGRDASATPTMSPA
jgi:hypothetical protein